MGSVSQEKRENQKEEDVCGFRERKKAMIAFSASFCVRNGPIPKLPNPGHGARAAWLLLIWQCWKGRGDNTVVPCLVSSQCRDYCDCCQSLASREM